jgi:G protein-coupled receptor 139
LIIKHYTDVSALKWYNYYKYHVGIPVTNTCSNTGVWLTLTFTIERYIGVCHPMKGKALCTPERAKYIILVVCTAVAIITAPDFFDKKVVEIHKIGPSGENITVYAGKATELAKMISFSSGYSYTAQVLFTFMPLILLMVFNSLLIRAVMIANRQRHAMANLNVAQSVRQERHSRDQHRITVMLITVVIVFLLCQSPQAIQNILISYYTHNGALTNVKNLLFTITANVFNLFVIINASANFILYSAFSTKFRRTFSRLFCRCVQNRRSTELMFSEAATAMTTNPATNYTSRDDCKKHLLHTGRNKGHVTYNWPSSNQLLANKKNGANNHVSTPVRSGVSTPSKNNGYTVGKQNNQNIVSCL